MDAKQRKCNYMNKKYVSLYFTGIDFIKPVEVTIGTCHDKNGVYVGYAY